MTPREKMLRAIESIHKIHASVINPLHPKEITEQAILSAVPLIVEMARDTEVTDYQTNDGVESYSIYKHPDTESIITALKVEK